MKFRRIFIPVAMIVTLVVQFMPGTVFGPKPVAASGCDAAQFVADVTIPDGTVFAPGAAMAKTWRFKNVGTCTWSTSYAIVFYSGSKMGAPSAVNLPTSVAPGNTVDVTVNMTAPSSSGHYRGNWMLRNDSNVLFGVGPSGTWVFFVDINVSSGSSVVGYDFAANACSATWTSGAGVLPCPGTDGNSSGFILQESAPKLENGSTGPAGFLTAPQNVTDGYIQGVYPAYTVQSGDHFMSIINCDYGSTGCYVTFQLQYQIGSGPINTLKSFKEKLDGLYYNLNVDLSSLVGQNVTFILKVLATGSPAGDRAVWAGPRITNAGGGSVPPLSSSCDKAAFIADITIPDGTAMTGGTAFTKTWRLMNVGSCTWTTSYRLVFNGGDYMGVASSAVNLPTSVVPGGTIDLSLNMIAPPSAGTYFSYWKLRNASGVDFGVGAGGRFNFFVKINVSSSFASAYNFSDNASSAAWTSGAGNLPFPGIDGDSRGFVLPLDNHQMEDGTSSPEGLLTFPQYVTDGYIQGLYPAFAVQNGDHFESYVGCQYHGPANCFVVFRLAYQIGGGTVTTLQTATERLDGLVYRMDVDLSSLAGQNVNFILRVEAFGSPSGDRAVWSAPRIIRNGSAPTGLTSSTTSITGDTPDPSIPSQSVAVSVTVSGSGSTPTGTVAISGADTNCTITLASGSGSCNVTFNIAGPKTIKATYSGNSTYAVSSDTESHTVTSGTTASTTSITGAVPDPSTPGQAVTVSVTVSGSGTTPTGTVSITGASTNCTITLSSGSGSCDAVFNTTGSKVITATYGGDSQYASSSDTQSHTVVAASASSATTITSNIPDPSTPGQTVVVSVTVSGAGIPTPSGTVAITGADSNCNILLAGGTGSCSVTFNTIGAKTLKASYSGDTNYAPSSGTASQMVVKGSTTTFITSDNPDPSTPTQPVLVKVTVFGAGVAPTGTVAISGADINCTLTLSGGTGSCSVVFNTIGAKTITATYSGDGNYLGSSDTEAHVVENVSTTTITSQIADPSYPGDAVTVNFKVSGGGAIPTGTVDVTGADTPCTGIALAGDGTGSCSVTFNTAGAKILTATYSGDANYSASSGTASHTVNKGPSTTTITAVAPEPSAPNASVLVTVTVVGAGVTPTGSVGISVSGQPAINCTATLVAGTGSCNVAFPTAGTYTITATYGGDGNYLPSTNPWTHTVA